MTPIWTGKNHDNHDALFVESTIGTTDSFGEIETNEHYLDISEGRHSDTRGHWGRFAVRAGVSRFSMILKKLDRLPPYVVRLLSRDKKGWHPLSTTEIAKRSGIPRSTVAMLSKLASWEKVSVGTLDKFTAACNVDISQPSKAFKTLKSAKMAHLKSGNKTQRAYFSRLFQTKK